MHQHQILTNHLTALSVVQSIHWYLETLGQYLAIHNHTAPNLSQYVIFGLSIGQTCRI